MPLPLLAKDLLSLARVKLYVIALRGIKGDQLDIFHRTLLLGEIGAGRVSLRRQDHPLSFSGEHKVDE